MKEVLNEELFRIQEIMGIKKTSINENFQTEQNNLISEQVGELSALLRGASTVGKFDRAGMSVVDNIVRNETESLSKTSKYVTKTYDSLDELSQAIAKKEIAANVAEDIATTIMKKIIVTPDGSKVVAKAWFGDNAAAGLQKTVKQIEKGTNLPPPLSLKAYRDYELTLNKINTGDADIDTALKNGLEETYGKPLKTAKTDAEKAIAEAKKLDEEFDTLRSEVISNIKKDPDLSTKKVANWFKLYDDKAKNLLKEKGDYDARKFLLDQLQKPSVRSKISGMYGSGSGVSKFLGKLFSGKGIIWTVSGGAIILAIIIIYQAIDKAPEAADTLAGVSYTVLKKAFPITNDASEKLLNAPLSSIPQEDLDKLYLKKDGYKLIYKTYENDALGLIEELKIETPSKNYEYTFQKNTGAVDEKITAKDGTSTVSGGVGGNVNTAITDEEKNKVLEKLGGKAAGFGSADLPYVKKIDNTNFTFEDASGKITNVTLP